MQVDAARKIMTPHPDLPGDQPRIKHLFREGSLVGLAQNMSKSRGRALMLKHEDKPFTQGCFWFATGTMDALNEILDHKYFDNSILTAGRDMGVDNPHSCTTSPCMPKRLLKS